MTWIRLDTDFPSHEMIGALAEALRCDLDRAGMSLIRVWCRVADHRPDGQLETVTDTALEDWAGWRGRRGAFARAFRVHCLDPDGTVKGWWRQERLLAHQEAKRKRPGPSTRVRQESGAGLMPEPAPGFCRETAGDEDVDEDVDGTASSPPAAQPTARLLNAIRGDPSRFGIIDLFEHIPPEESPEVWSSILLGCLQTPVVGGRSATVAELAEACTDFPAVAKGRWTPRLFRGCVKQVMQGPAPKGGRARPDAITVAQSWAAKEDVA